MRLIILLTIFFSLSSFAKLDLSKKQYIIRLKSPDRLSLKSANDEVVNKEIYEVPVAAKEEFLEEMNAREDVVSVEENILLHYLDEPGFDVFSVGDDELFSFQWSMQDIAGGIDIKRAWELSTGSSDVVVAVIDSGILSGHSQISASLLPGADFVSDHFIANDGGGRDMDPSDPGNWNTAGQCGEGTKAKASNWHGTHVAGIIAAAKDGFGTTGVAPNVSILPIRAMGRCGGRLNDVADAIRWSVGGTVSGMPNNNHPAQVINLSLGGFGDCESNMQSAIDFARSRGATVLVAVGNEGLNLDRVAMVPVSCRGVVNVGSNDSNARKTSFSNYGVEVDVVAPGGFHSNGDGILSLGNDGATTPGNNNYIYKVGTSMATPIVAGIAAMIYTVNDGIYPDQVEQVLKDNSVAIPNVGTGRGLVQAYESVLMGESVIPDPDFRTDEPVVNRQTASSRFRLSDTGQEEVAACGSVDLSGGSGGPGGGFLASLFLGLAMMVISSKLRLLKAVA